MASNGCDSSSSSSYLEQDGRYWVFSNVLCKEDSQNRHGILYDLPGQMPGYYRRVSWEMRQGGIRVLKRLDAFPDEGTFAPRGWLKFMQLFPKLAAQL